MHDVVIEQKSAREVVDIVRSIQDEHSKEISDGAGNRIVQGAAAAKPINKRPVMFPEYPLVSPAPAHFTFNVSEGQDLEQLVKRFRSEINIWSSPETKRHSWSGAVGKGRGRGAGSSGRGGGKGKG